MGSTPNPGRMIIQDTLSGRKEPFTPIHRNRINFFVCGPTVYDDSHIGHARTYIAFDVVARYFKYRGFSVFYLQNITDVDDKIIQRAAELQVSPLALAREFEQRYLEDMCALGVTFVNLYARATEHIPEIIGQIERLMEKGFAYETENGVYFDESRFADFGKLSHQTAEDLEKHRIEPDPTKRNPGDFSLWKKRQDGGEVTWDSPWGKGRPGWHIEDTAITETYFGPQYDIHGGAMDLIFPHHEAEIAQMEATSGKRPLVRCWMHTGFLNVRGEKMSKSLGNFITIRDMLKKYDAETFRFFVLSAHYRSPIDFSKGALEQSRKSLERIRQLARTINEQIGAKKEMRNEIGDKEIDAGVIEARSKFIEHMDNDFNTPYALR
ncbi:MAG TPA: cysteine--tRNA ligase, partial [Methanotrichaceae archaeon]|nr:cysteine--tRNA ligase [Methanotrichaceae archaeon]